MISEVISDFDGSLRDLYDGEVYRSYALSLPEDDCYHISFTFCTDGSPLYKSSKASLWPLTLMINELKNPSLRMEKNCFGRALVWTI